MISPLKLIRAIPLTGILILNAIPAPPLMPSLYIVGDSISVHYAPFLEKHLHGLFTCIHREGAEEALRNLDLPTGANAGDSSRVLQFLRWKQEHGGIDADYLLLNCGLHDLRTDPVSGRKKTPLETYTANLRAIVATAATLRPRLIWVRITPCHDAIHNRPGLDFHRHAADVDAYNAAADSVMREHNIPSIDLHTFTLNQSTVPDGSDLYCDHIHFTPAIREKQAAFIAGWLTGYVALSH
ncbi:SGNH/GDSL hydrolase family protein [Opitutaceae bacterium TAV4]|nr:SGNH/GDSL hydrolase family protein [Opitutaceae bacterium TAV4]RRK00980.1 SGNH/GDSL hydrolase family protein [Opitutaceae bacterium TAV3]